MEESCKRAGDEGTCEERRTRSKDEESRESARKEVVVAEEGMGGRR